MDSPFAPAGGWQIYNSYVTDPYYRTRMLEGFAGLLALAVVVKLPGICNYCFSNRRFGSESGWFLSEEWTSSSNESDSEGSKSVYTEKQPPRSGRWSAGRPLSPFQRAVTRCSAVRQSLSIYSVPVPRLNPLKRRGSRRSYLALSTGSITLLVAVGAIILATLLPEQQLKQNANRLGFFGLGLLPIIFLFSMKSFSPLALLIGQSYEKLNFIHRWLGRALLVLILAHASLWINNWTAISSSYVLSQLSQSKQIYGLTALGFLLILAGTSLPFIRSFSYPTFFTFHVIGFVGLITAVSYHTPYSSNWAGYAVSALYGADLVGRICRWRIREATLEAMVDNEDGQSTGMTRIKINDLNTGWRAGQHVHLRLFYSTPSTSGKKGWRNFVSTFRSLESHPFTIAQAPPNISVLPEQQSGGSEGFSLYARAVTDRSLSTWTNELNIYVRESLAQKQQNLLALHDLAEKQGPQAEEELSHLLSTDALVSKTVSTIAMLEGPYGGLGYVQLDTQETVLLVACGSGMSFVVALLDEIVGRTVRGLRGARTRVVEVVWVVKHASCISWFSATLSKLVEAAAESGIITVNVRIYVTCTSYDSANPPNCSCNDFRSGTTAPSGCCCSTPIPTDLEASATSNPGSNVLSSSTASTKNLQIIYEKPVLPNLLKQVIKNAVNPCNTCIDCRCAEYSGDGTCGGAGCGCGGCQMPKEMDVDGGKGRDRMVREDEIEVMPTFLGGANEEAEEEGEVLEKNKGGCCASKVERKIEAKSGCCYGKKQEPASCCDGQKADSKTGCRCSSTSSNKAQKASCCKPSSSSAQKVSSCCAPSISPSAVKQSGCGCGSSSTSSSSSASSSSTTAPRTPLIPSSRTDFDHEKASYPPSSSSMPAEIRTGGLGVAACGPQNMLAEFGNAVAGVSVRERVKIGGIVWHAEGFEL